MVKNGRHPAFTLLECIIALLVTAMVISVVAMTLPTAQRETRRNLMRPLDWQLCLAELEADDHRFRLVQVEATRLTLDDTKTGKRFHLNCGKRLYLSCNGGYMELLDQIQSCSLRCQQLDRERVRLEVTRNDQHHEVGVVRFLPQKSDPEKQAKPFLQNSTQRLRPGASDGGDDHPVGVDDCQSQVLRRPGTSGATTRHAIH